jgi:hypothetical protein
MVAAGLTDILVPFNLVGPAKMERLTRLAPAGADDRRVDSRMLPSASAARPPPMVSPSMSCSN